MFMFMAPRFGRIDDEDVLEALTRAAGHAGIGDDHLCGQAAFVGRALPRPLSSAHAPRNTLGRTTPLPASADAPAPPIDHTLPFKARAEGFELVTAARDTVAPGGSTAAAAAGAGVGASQRALRITQHVPGLMTPAERRRLLEIEVAQHKAESLRRSLSSLRARRERLALLQHQHGALGIGGLAAPNAAPDTHSDEGEMPTPAGSRGGGSGTAMGLSLSARTGFLGAAVSGVGRDVYAAAHDAADAERARVLENRARRRERLGLQTTSLACHGYDIIAPTAPTEPLVLVQRRGRCEEVQGQYRDTRSRVFPAASKPLFDPVRAQRLVNEEARGRDFDLVTGTLRPAPLRPAPTSG